MSRTTSESSADFLSVLPTHNTRSGSTLAAEDLIGADPAELAAEAHELIRVNGPVVLGEQIDDELQLVRFLREATSHTLRIGWVLGGRPLLELRNLSQLVPPVSGVDSETNAYAASWRTAFRYGTYFYRNGPEFVLVKDVRPDGPAAHLTITGASSAHFAALAESSRLAELDSEEMSALDDAVQFGLAVRGEQRFVTLPFRMRHWPVPFLSV
ncbi:DUF5825 family protein [Amycolatopsis sp. NPDC054798]